MKNQWSELLISLVKIQAELISVKTDIAKIDVTRFKDTLTEFSQIIYNIESTLKNLARSSPSFKPIYFHLALIKESKDEIDHLMEVLNAYKRRDS